MLPAHLRSMYVQKQTGLKERFPQTCLFFLDEEVAIAKSFY